MDRKEISAFLANCKASEMMAYADLGDQGTVVVADDGKKYRYSNDQLDQAESKVKASKPKPRRPTKRKVATKTRKKPTTKPTTKPAPTKKGNGR